MPGYLVTIRNCESAFRFKCPKRWEALAPTGTEGVRRCGACRRLVYRCETDEDVIAHAKAGHCIAKALLDATGQQCMMVGEPSALYRTTDD